MDLLGNEISMGDLVLIPKNKTQYQGGLITNFGRGTVHVDGIHDKGRWNRNASILKTRKKEEVCVRVNEQQFINNAARKATSLANRDGIIQINGRRADVNGQYRIVYDEYTIEQWVGLSTRTTIMAHRIIQGIPLEEYMPTDEERQFLLDRYNLHAE